MKTRATTNKARRAMAALLAATLLPAPLACAQNASGRVARSTWSVKGTKSSLRIEGRDLVLFSKASQMGSIPLQKISKILYDTQAYRPVPGMMNSWVAGSVKAAEGSQEAAGFAVMAGFAGIVVMAPFLGVKSKRHYLHVVWSQEGAEKTSSFHMEPWDAQSLAAALSGSTGLPWQNLPQERANAKKLLKEQKKKAKK